MKRPRSREAGVVTDELVWEDPPQFQHGGWDRKTPPPWVLRLTPLIEKPGVWARVHTTTRATAASTVTHLRRRERRIPEGVWEFACRTSPDRRGVIYARYLGPERAS